MVSQEAELVTVTVRSKVAATVTVAVFSKVAATVTWDGINYLKLLRRGKASYSCLGQVELLLHRLGHGCGFELDFGFGLGHGEHHGHHLSLCLRRIQSQGEGWLLFLALSGCPVGFPVSKLLFSHGC